MRPTVTRRTTRGTDSRDASRVATHCTLYPRRGDRRLSRSRSLTVGYLLNTATGQAFWATADRHLDGYTRHLLHEPAPRTLDDLIGGRIEPLTGGLILHAALGCWWRSNRRVYKVLL
jgi:hypothetical protein